MRWYVLVQFCVQAVSEGAAEDVLDDELLKLVPLGGPANWWERWEKR